MGKKYIPRKYSPNWGLILGRVRCGHLMRHASLFLDKSVSTVSRIESGESRASLETRRVLAERYGGTEINYRQFSPRRTEYAYNVKRVDKMRDGMRDLIYHSGLTVSELAELSNMDSNVLTFCLTGRRNMGEEVAGRVSPVLGFGCSVEKLLSLNER